MATLGCASTYDAEIRFQGGQHLWTKIEGLTELEWSRKRDDWSESTITVSKSLAGADCCGKLGQTRTWGHELRIYRDKKPVWEGPILRTRERRSSITFEARDMLFWLERRQINPAGNLYHYWGGADTGALIRQVVTDAFPLAPDWNPGLIEYAVLQDTGTTSTTEKLWKNTTTVGEVVRDLIGSGVDLFTVGRRIYAVSDKAAANIAPYRLRESDFLTELEVIENGLDAATLAFCVGGQPVDGAGNPVQDVAPVVGSSGGVDPFYGMVTRFTTSQNVVRQDVASGIADAVRSYGFPPPVDIIVPNGAKLSPQAPVEIGQLIPGRVFEVSLENYCRNVRQRFRLNELNVEWNSDTTESVAVSLASGGPVTEAAA